MRKLILSTLLLTMLCSFTVEAASPITVNAIISTYEKSVENISTYADIIEIKYRINNITGTVQYRRWNASRGVWVDKNWIDL